ncbi:hypothetical protein GCM10020331_045520 [Ectobacillus funiculus]
MAPADDPQLLVYVAVKQPHLKDAETGATPLADIFKSVTKKNSLQYLKVKPSVVKDTSKLAAKRKHRCSGFDWRGAFRCKRED